jgi:triphosphoribosyl-dephospho-CoA synthase CitG
MTCAVPRCAPQPVSIPEVVLRTGIFPDPGRIAHAGPEDIAALACRALATEACLAPKPGLVDRFNNGAHTDMDLRLFLVSARSLRPYLSHCAEAAWRCNDPASLFPRLKARGMAAEQEMFRATNGVNTHKGAIFSLGLLTAAGAMAVRDGTGLDGVAETTRALCRNLVEQDLMKLAAPGTAGERCFQRYTVSGARGQAQAGYPLVIEEGLPFLERLLSSGQPFEEACIQTLLLLITTVDDTNLLSRGGRAGLDFARNSARRLLESGEAADMQAVARLDREFISRNLSPGGSADLLAATCFLHFLRRRTGLAAASPLSAAAFPHASA